MEATTATTAPTSHAPETARVSSQTKGSAFLATPVIFTNKSQAASVTKEEQHMARQEAAGKPVAPTDSLEENACEPREPGPPAHAAVLTPLY